MATLRTYTVRWVRNAVERFWIDKETGLLFNSGGLLLPIKTLTNADSPYTVSEADYTLLADCTDGAITINLPAVSDGDGRLLRVKKTDATANTATLDGSGSETVDGATTAQALGLDSDTVAVRPLDYFLLAAQGLYTGVTSNLKFGRNSDIDAAEDIWEGGGDYTGFPTGSAETIDVSSSDANDTSAGTGARTIRLIGLDANGERQTEDVTLNGTSNVTTTNTWTRCSRAYVLTAGSGGANAGVITGHHTTTTANVFFSMQAGINQTQVCADTVPANEAAYIYSVTVAGQRATGSTVGDFSLRARESGGVFRQRLDLSAGNGVRAREDLKMPLVLPALTDFKLRCENISAINGDFVGRMQYVLISS